MHQINTTFFVSFFLAVSNFDVAVFGRQYLFVFVDILFEHIHSPSNKHSGDEQFTVHHRWRIGAH